MLWWQPRDNTSFHTIGFLSTNQFSSALPRTPKPKFRWIFPTLQLVAPPLLPYIKVHWVERGSDLLFSTFVIHICYLIELFQPIKLQCTSPLNFHHISSMFSPVKKLLNKNISLNQGYLIVILLQTQINIIYLM